VRGRRAGDGDGERRADLRLGEASAGSGGGERLPFFVSDAESLAESLLLEWADPASLR
jgi:hypothetical protein